MIRRALGRSMSQSPVMLDDAGAQKVSARCSVRPGANSFALSAYVEIKVRR